MPTITGVVQAISAKDRNTKRGVSQVYGVLVGDNWYNSGFKKPSCEKGDNVEIDFTVGQYGNDISSINTTTKAASKPVTTGGKGGMNKTGLEIMRQNAVTNANSFLQHNTDGYDVDLLLSTAAELVAFYTGQRDEKAADDVSKDLSESIPGV